MIFFMSIVAFAIIQAPPGNFLDDYIAALNDAYCKGVPSCSTIFEDGRWLCTANCDGM